jgi:sporulation protein YqfC
MNENSKRTTQKIIHTLDLPPDLFLGLPNISLSGNAEVYISNHHGILSYEEECVNLLVKDYQIQIKGRGLHIFSYSKDDVTIRGYIRSLEFL